MKKLMLLFTVIFASLLAGCGITNGNVVHQEGNLIVTNYSECESRVEQEPGESGGNAAKDMTK